MCTFSNLKLQKTIFENCQINECDFVETDLTQASFENSEFKDTRFQNANLKFASFKKAKNYRINPSNNFLKKTKFSFPEVIHLLDSFDIEIE